MKNVVVVLGAGQIGQAIARRVGVGKHVLLADLREENAKAAADVLDGAGYDVSIATVDASSREAVEALVKTATGLGDVTGLIHSAGVSPSQAAPATILKVDLYGTALVLEQFGNVIARGGSGVVIASQSGHRLPPLTAEQNKALATTPVEELLRQPFLHRRMIELSPVGRGGTPDEVAAVGALLMGPDGGFISGSDFLMDGGVTASYWFGELAPN